MVLPPTPAAWALWDATAFCHQIPSVFPSLRRLPWTVLAAAVSIILPAALIVDRIEQQKILIWFLFCLFSDVHRQISGAMIRISNCEDRESSTERTITITGSAESVALAQYLINTRLDV
jgi:KH domain